MSERKQQHWKSKNIQNREEKKLRNENYFGNILRDKHDDKQDHNIFMLC